MGRRSRILLGVCVWLSVLAACTQSHDVERLEQAGQAGTGGRGGGGAGGARAGTGGGGAGSAQDETCETGCSGASLLGFPVPGCCTDDDKCGLDIGGLGLGEGCAELNAAGTPNDACPSQSLGGFLTLAGCCRPDGTCGVLDTVVGLGCTSAGAQDVTSCEP